MPTADSFTALGMGNGLPLCHTGRRDISTWGYSNSKWTTLSGVNSDNYNSFDDATLSQKVDSSRDMAMRLYWNKFMSNGISASSSGSYEYSSFGGTYELDYSWNDIVTISSGNVNVREPINRVCVETGYFNSATQRYGRKNPHRFYYDLSDWTSRLYAFYDSDKFLGYGADLSENEAYLDVADGNWGRCRINYMAIRQYPQSDVNGSYFKMSTDFSTISGMHFVRERRGNVRYLIPPSGQYYYNQSISPSVTLSANGVQLSLSYNWDYYNDGTGEEAHEDVDFQQSVSGPTSIDFYTYT